MKICLKEPSLEQHKTASLAWYNRLKHCFWSNWPQEYKDLSFKTNALALSKAENKLLLECFDSDLTEGVCGTELQKHISEEILKFDEGVFIKLESRSPKDNYWGEITRYRCCSWRDVTASLYSER